MTESTTSAPAPAADRDQYPPGIPYIVGNEGAERFSFYGMKAILYVYLAQLFVRFATEGASPEEIENANVRATEVTHLFIAGVYAFPLIGAILADRLLGKFKVIFWVSLIYCVGQGVLAFAGRLGEMQNYRGAELGMFIGLGLIALGSGGIKPCVSANVGDQFTERNAHLVTKIFQIFYFIINFGSFFATLLIPYLFAKHGPVIAFGVPGILMALATVVFWMGRKKFVPIAPKPGGKLGLLDTLVTVLLFSPLFGLIYGHSVKWHQFEMPADASYMGIAMAVLSFYALLLAGVAVAIALGIGLFLWRQRIQRDNGFLATLLYSVRQRRNRRPGQGFFDPAREEFGDEVGDGPPAVLKVMVVFSMVSVFWALFDQHASTWVEQARHMNRDLTVPYWLGRVLLVGVPVLAVYGGTWLILMVSNVKVPRRTTVAVVGALALALLIGGGVDLVQGKSQTVALKATQFQALNPLMVMMIIPFLNVAVWGPLTRRGITVKPLLKMTIGMFLAAGAFGLAALLQQRVEAADGQVHALWQIAPYLVMTTSEVLISITGLEFAYTQAPRAMKSTIMGFWLLCVTFGNLLVAFLAPLRRTYELSEFFWLFAVLMAVAAVVFAILARFYRGRVYLQEAEAEA